MSGSAQAAVVVVAAVAVAFATFVLRPWAERVTGTPRPRFPAWAAVLFVLLAALIGAGVGRATRSAVAGFAGFVLAECVFSAVAIYLRGRTE